MKRNILLILLYISAISCNKFEFSPNQVFDRDSYRDLNAKNLERLGDGKLDDTIRFVLTGDTQRSHEETNKFYKKVNGMQGIDFVIVAGDITEFGVFKEMGAIAESLNKLNVPYVAVIGNHDLTSRGKESFINMFGDLNYSFVYKGTKFICHDTNGREYGFTERVPDINWLNEQLQPQEGVENYVAISHVPPNNDDFDPKLVADYVAAFENTPNFLASFHGHTHAFTEFSMEGSSVPYIITSAMGNREFLLVEIVNNELSFEQIYF